MPYPDGYRAVLPYLLHVHVKDAAVVDDATGLTRWAPIGSGAVDYAGQIDACAARYAAMVATGAAGRRPASSTRERLQGDSVAGVPVASPAVEHLEQIRRSCQSRLA